MSGIKILVVDDEARLRKLVKDFLIRENYEVIEANDGQEALDMFMDYPDISLILLDVMMPKLSGFDVLKEDDELMGFSLGVDEYISKPFSPKVLVARVNAVLRRLKDAEADDKLLSVGGIEMSIDAHEVLIDGNRLDLSVKEFEPLEYFIRNKGIALSREKILNSVWDYDYFGDARTIDTHVKKLRSKMGEKGEYIKTIWGMGYKFEVEE